LKNQSNCVRPPPGTQARQTRRGNGLMDALGTTGFQQHRNAAYDGRRQNGQAAKEHCTALGTTGCAGARKSK